MASGNPDLTIRVAANIESLKADMAAAAATLKELKAATEETAASTNLLTGMFDKLGESFIARVAEGVLLRDAVRELISLGKEAITDAAGFEDLSRATGVSIEAIQQLSYVGTEFSVTTEQMARGVEQLSSKLATGDANATKAVQMLGLSVKDLLAAGPEEAFLQIADATGRVEDPMMKAGLATEEFGGKLAKVLLPALADLRQRMLDVPKEAIISDLNVTRAHDFDVELQHLLTHSKALAAEGLGGIGGWLERINFPFFEAHQHATVLNHDFEDLDDTTKGAVIPTVDLLANRLKALREDATVPLTQAQQDNIIELEKYGESQKDIAQLVGTSVIAVHEFEAAHKLAEVELKKYEAALADLQTVGVDWKDTLALMDQQTRVMAEHMLAAGAPMKDLELLFHLSAAEAKALATELKELTTEQKLQAAATLEVTKLTDEYNDLVVKRTGTTTDIQLANIKKWADDLTARMVKAKTDTVEFYDALEKVSKEKTDAVMLDWTYLAAHNSDTYQRSLQQIADKAAATYTYMANASSGFSGEAINDAKKIADATRQAAADWEASFDAAGKKVAASVTATTATVMGSLDAIIAKSDAVTATLTAQANASQNVAYGHTHADYLALLMAIQSGTFSSGAGGNATLIAELNRDWDLQGNWIGGARAGGGPVSGGVSYLVGERGPEMFVPGTSGSILPNTGGGDSGPQVINLVVDGRVLASVVNDQNSRTIRQSRKWPGA